MLLSPVLLTAFNSQHFDNSSVRRRAFTCEGLEGFLWGSGAKQSHGRHVAAVLAGAVTQRAHVASFSHRRVGQLKPNKDARKHKYRAAIFMSHYGNEYRDNH